MNQPPQNNTELLVFQSIHKKSYWFIFVGAFGIVGLIGLPFIAMFVSLYFEPFVSSEFSISSIWMMLSLFILLFGVAVGYWSKREIMKLQYSDKGGHD